jgi:anti-sigma factor RsiW
MSQGCDRWRDEVGVYVIGVLDLDERAAMRLHLAACPACRAEYEYLLPVRDWLAQTKRHLAACAVCRVEYTNLDGVPTPSPPPQPDG